MKLTDFIEELLRMAIPNSGIPNFAERAERSIGVAASAMRFTDTQNRRMLRRFSHREANELLGMGKGYVASFLDHPDMPESIEVGREKTLSVDDIMLIRALAEGRKGRRRTTLFWRKQRRSRPSWASLPRASRH